jgi:magnesium chelatase family protein
MLTGRGLDRVLRVARTIADLQGSDGVELTHVSRALNLRLLASGEEAAA